MPRLNHENLGSIQRTAYLTATVVSTDSEFDTMEFTGIGQCPPGSNIPIFYHCDKDSVQRDNGALEGASDAFSEGDEVIVQCEVLDSTAYLPLYVIGFVDKPKSCLWEPWGETLCANHQWQFWGFTEFYLCPALPFTDSDEAGSVLSIDIVAGILDYKLDLTESEDSYGYSTVYWNLEGEPTANIKVGIMKIKVKATSEGNAGENNYTHIWIQTASPYKSVLFTLSATNPSSFPCFIGDNDGENMEIDLTDYGFTLDAAITYIGLGIRSTLGRKGQLEMDYISF